MNNETPNTVQALKAHISIIVSNVERSIEFYRKMLGIEPSKARAGYAKFDVQNPPLNLAMNEVALGAEGKVSRLSHLGIQVRSTEDVLAMRERWTAAGLTARDEMQTSCCYAMQDKSWVADPDGNQWEVFVVLEDNLHENKSSVRCGIQTAASQMVQIGSSDCAVNEQFNTIGEGK